jgi:formylmethanofuran dehydrogenase subunit B
MSGAPVRIKVRMARLLQGFRKDDGSRRRNYIAVSIRSSSCALLSGTKTRISVDNEDGSLDSGDMEGSEVSLGGAA